MASGEAQMAKPKVARMGERMASRASRRIMKCSTCDARLAIPNASGRTRNRVLLPIRCNRRNCTERCQPSLQSRGPHLPPRLPARALFCGMEHRHHGREDRGRTEEPFDRRNAGVTLPSWVSGRMRDSFR